MSKYTITSENIYFLNDKNIVSSLTGCSQTGMNPIPSLDLISCLNDELTGAIGEITTSCETIRENLQTSCNNLNGRIAAVDSAWKLSCEMLSGNVELSTSTLLDNLAGIRSDLTSKYLPLSGGKIDGKLSIDGELNIENLLVAKNKSIMIDSNISVNAPGGNMTVTVDQMNLNATNVTANVDPQKLYINKETLHGICMALSVSKFEYDSDTSAICLNFGDDRILSIKTNDFIDRYTAGLGLKLDASGKKFSIDTDEVAMVNDIKRVTASMAHCIKFERHYTFSKDSVTIKDILESQAEPTPSYTVKNGLMISLECPDEQSKCKRYEIRPRSDAAGDAPIYASHGDVLIVHSGESKDIPMSDIYLTGDKQNVYIFSPAIHRYEFADAINKLSCKIALSTDCTLEQLSTLSGPFANGDLAIIGNTINDEDPIKKLSSNVEYQSYIYENAHQKFIPLNEKHDARNVIFEHNISAETTTISCEGQSLEQALSAFIEKLDGARQQLNKITNALGGIKMAIDADATLSGGISMSDPISTIISATVFLFNQLSSLDISSEI